MAPGGNAYGCGQCMPCRINRRRVWTHRILLETTQHQNNSFWTLTYSDENMPRTSGGIPTLAPKHLTDFMKRLRWDYQPLKIRYFNVGEYGDETDRPHYHLALFNFPACSRGLSQFDRRGNCCPVCDRVRTVWGFGLVHSGQLSPASSAYVAGYCTKKLTSREAIERDAARRGDQEYKEREPEFARMSKRPGIGAGFIPEVASALLSHNLDSTLSDVPSSLRHGPSVQPLGRYLTRMLRVQTGMHPNAPQETINQYQETLRPLREAAKAIAPKGLFSETLKSMILDANEGQYIKLKAKSWRNRKRGSI